MAKSVEVELWRGAIVPASLVAVAGTAIATAINGSSGLLGGILASLIVLIFLVIHLYISKISTDMEPIMTMVLAMISYFAKLLILGAFLFILMKTIGPETLNRKSFAAVASAITFAWLAGEIRAFLKLRLHLPMPNQGKPEGQA
ncbi:MAG: hypothetical protein WDO06_02245 [Actinomycetota bacterium]